MTEFFTKHEVLSEPELQSRLETYLERYCLTIKVEANLTLAMARSLIFPATIRYQNELASTCANLKVVDYEFDTDTLDQITALVKSLQDSIAKLEATMHESNNWHWLEGAMEHWANDNIPVAGETFREFVKKLYQRNELVNGQFRLNGKRVLLDEITCPLLFLVADNDDLVPPESTLALQQHVKSTDVTTMSIDAGHIGLAVSCKAHRQLWPNVAMWIADRSTVRAT